MSLMWYRVDFDRAAIENTPTFKRRAVLKNFLKVLVSPIKVVYDQWQLNRLDNLYKVDHNWQVCYMRKALNDRFDPDLRRIYITNGNVFETVYIYTEGEDQDVYTYTVGEDQTLYLRTEAETADTGLDFLVYVPQELYQPQFFRLNSMIRFYKLGGKRYKILIANE